MRRRTPGSAVLLPLGDLVLVIGVFLLGFWVRHFLLAGVLEGQLGLPGGFRLDIWQYVISGAVMGLIEVLMLQAFGVYREVYGLAQIEELAWILRSSFMAVLVTFAFTFATRQLLFSRFVLVFAFPAASLSVACWHWLFHRLSRSIALRRGRATRVALLGSGRETEEVAEFMRTRATVPYEVVARFGSVPGGGAPDTEGGADGLAPMFGRMDELGVDELIITERGLTRESTAAIIYRCEQEGIQYKLAADVFDLVSLTTRIVHLGGTTMIESAPPPLSGSRRLLKRAMDLAVAVPAFVLLLPLGLVVSICIVVDSGFPVFYLQTRLGRDNRRFRMVKFRSMRRGADREKKELLGLNESSGPLFKMRSDPRVTGVGRILRRWSLDELPQLLNVITGSMSLVGPRPPLPEEVSEYSERQMKRLQTVPGITGVWQISGRSSLTFNEMVKLDLYYVDNWSIWMDVSLLLLTVPAILSRRGAY